MKKRLSVLIKPASSMCNLRCKYCFYANISSLREVRCYGIMSYENTKKMIDNIFLELSAGDSVNFGFQGGEPTMAGIQYFKNFIKIINEKDKNVSVTYSIQTNGTFIDEEWCNLFFDNNFLVGLSLDAFKENHDINRVDSKRLPTFERVLKTKKLFDKFNVEYNILTVLTEQLAEMPDKVFDFIKDEDIKYIQFIPCLNELDKTEKSIYALTPKKFYKFYRKIYRLWREEFAKGNYISIKFIDDVFNLFVKRQVTACGIAGNCSVQFVIESNGSVYPCDFYALDEYKIGNIFEEKLSDMYYDDIAIKFLTEKSWNRNSNACNTCQYSYTCNGGCKRMSESMYLDKDNFCGFQSILDIIIPDLDWIIEKMQKILV